MGGGGILNGNPWHASVGRCHTEACQGLSVFEKEKMEEYYSCE